MTDQQAEALSQALRQTTPSLGSSALADRIAHQVPDLDSRTSRQIVDSLLSLIAAKQRIWPDLSPEALASDVAESESLSLADGVRGSFIGRLSELLELESLRIASKAQDLRTENAHVFSGARLFTDIRPVFGDDATQTPAAAVIMETLKIEYIGDVIEPRAFFVSLDHEDLRALRATIDRALDKTDSLKRLLSSSDVAYWEYESPSEGKETTD